MIDSLPDPGEIPPEPQRRADEPPPSLCDDCQCRREGDVYVLTVPGPLSVTLAADIRKQVKAAMPDERVTFIPKGYDLRRVRLDDMRALRDSIDAVLQEVQD